MLNFSSPYHAKGPQRRERLLNLATLRKPTLAQETNEPKTQTPPPQEMHSVEQLSDADSSE